MVRETMKPTLNTVMIGPTEASARIPKPSVTPGTLAPIPRPIASTSGTVIGPVVTPALSHPKLTNSSDENQVSTSSNQ